MGSGDIKTGANALESSHSHGLIASSAEHLRARKAAVDPPNGP